MRCYEKICEQAVRAAGRVLLEKLGRVSVREKAPADLVTEADIQAQEIASRMILEAFPDHAVLGEEETADARPVASDAEYCWILDPLDGTTNFVHGVPHFSVSLALRHRDALLTAAVFHPIADELFTATAGSGASLNGRPIRTSRVTTAAAALAGIGLPPGVDERSADLQAFLRALPQMQSMRRTGSAALNLAYVAAGRFDACWSFSTRVWDMAAGVLLVREAGGITTSPSGAPLNLTRGDFLACATPELHAALLAIFRQSPTIAAES